MIYIRPHLAIKPFEKLDDYAKIPIMSKRFPYSAVDSQLWYFPLIVLS